MPPKKKAKTSSSSSSANDADAARYRASKAKTIEALTCVCCLEVTRPPLFQCQNGHTLPCEDCRSKMVNNKCPTCQIAFDDATKGRNLSLEQTAADIEIECKRGCGSSIAYSSLVEHENDCVGKVAVRCSRPNCDHKSPLWFAAIAHHKEVSQHHRAANSLAVRIIKIGHSPNSPFSLLVTLHFALSAINKTKSGGGTLRFTGFSPYPPQIPLQ
jgi:hypothetical protein